jgi:glycogen operon protein
MLILLNADSAEQNFGLPGPEVNWTMLLDTAQPELPETPLADGHFLVAAYGVALLTARLE